MDRRSQAVLWRYEMWFECQVLYSQCIMTLVTSVWASSFLATRELLDRHRQGSINDRNGRARTALLVINRIPYSSWRGRSVRRPLHEPCAISRNDVSRRARIDFIGRVGAYCHLWPIFMFMEWHLRLNGCPDLV